MDGPNVPRARLPRRAWAELARLLRALPDPRARALRRRIVRALCAGRRRGRPVALALAPADLATIRAAEQAELDAAQHAAPAGKPPA